MLAWHQVGRFFLLAPYRTPSVLYYVFSDALSPLGNDMLTSNTLFFLDEFHTAYLLLFLDAYLAIKSNGLVDIICFCVLIIVMIGFISGAKPLFFTSDLYAFFAFCDVILNLWLIHLIYVFFQSLVVFMLKHGFKVYY